MISRILGYLIYAEIILMLSLILFYYPPEYVPIKDTNKIMKVMVEDEVKEMEMVFAWKQNSLKIKGVLVLFPTTREIVWYSESEQLEVAIKPDEMLKLEELYEGTFDVPMWRYWTFVLGLLLIVATIGVENVIDSIIADKEKWNRIKEKGSFTDFSRYILASDIYSRHKEDARRKMLEKANGYKLFIKLLTKNRIKDEENILLQIIDYIIKTGDQYIYLKIDSQNSVKEVIPLVKEGLKEIKSQFEINKSKPDFTNDELVEYENNIKLCEDALALKYHKTLPYFTKIHFEEREKLLRRFVNQLFKIVFGDYVVLIENGEKPEGMSLEIKYDLQTNPEAYSREKDKDIPEEKRKLYPKVTFYWDVIFSIEKKELLREEIDTMFDGDISWKENNLEDYYNQYVLKSYGEFGKDFLKLFGVDIPEQLEAKRYNDSDEISDIIKEFNDDMKGQWQDKAKERLSEMAENYYSRNGDKINLLLGNIPSEIEDCLNEYSDIIEVGTEAYEIASEVADIIKDD